MAFTQQENACNDKMAVKIIQNSFIDPHHVIQFGVLVALACDCRAESLTVM